MNLCRSAGYLAALAVVLGGGLLCAVVVGFVGVWIAARLSFPDNYDPQFPSPGGEGFLLLLWLIPSAISGFWIGVFLAVYGLYKFNQRRGSPDPSGK
jgi:hypothetical protein